MHAAKILSVEPHVNHWSMAVFRETVTLKQLQSIALHHDTILRNGRLCNLKYKRIVPGVYSIWYESRQYA